MPMSKLPVSVLIIAQNSQTSLRRCLDSLQDFAEIVLVDGGSTDQTIAIAQEYPNVVVHHSPWPGFIAQRNISIDKASHDWCLMMDSDEAMTPAAVAYVEKTITSANPKKLYRIMRTEYFEGQALEYGHGRSNYQERLFQTKHIRYTGGNHHEHLIDGRLAKVGDPEMADFPPELRILHWPGYDFAEWIMKMPRFVTLVAEEKLARGKRVGILELFIAMPAGFIQVYGKSWRLGKIGFLIACREACYRTLIKAFIFARTHYHKEKVGNEFERKHLG